MKKISLFLVLSCLFTTGVFAQVVTNNPLSTTMAVSKPTGDPKTTPNYLANLMYYYDQVSARVIIPDSVINLFKSEARKNNISENLAIKLSTALRPIFNNSLTPQERIEVINHFRQIDAWDKVVPQSFYDDNVRRLQKLY